MVTEYLKEDNIPSWVLFPSALVTNLTLLHSRDLNLTIFFLDNFSPFFWLYERKKKNVFILYREIRIIRFLI